MGKISKLNYQDFWNKVDSLAADYSCTDDKYRKKDIEERIAICFFENKWVLKHLWYRLSKGERISVNTLMNDSMYKDYESEFYLVLVECIRKFDPTRGALFRTYFYNSLSYKTSCLNGGIFRPYLKEESDIVYSYDETDGEEEHSLFDNIENEYIEAEQSDYKMMSETLVINYLNSVSNYLRGENKSKPKKRKKMYISTLSTRLMVEYIRKDAGLIEFLKKIERDIINNLNLHLIDYTYKTKTRTIIMLHQNHLKTYSCFKYVPASSVPDDEIKVPFEYTILRSFFEDVYNETISIPAISGAVDKFLDFNNSVKPEWVDDQI